MRLCRMCGEDGRESPKLSMKVAGVEDSYAMIELGRSGIRKLRGKNPETTFAHWFGFNVFCLSEFGHSVVGTCFRLVLTC